MHKAEAKHDGRVEHTARIRGFHWSCTCRPGDGHDHAVQHAKLERGLEKRDAMLDGLNGLVGDSGRVGLLRYRITDCNLQIHGPEKWVLFVAWEEEVPGGTAFRQRSIAMADPEACPTPEAVQNMIRGEVAENGNKIAAAIRAAGDFNSGDA